VIETSSIEQLEALGEALPGFTVISDLKNWLRGNGYGDRSQTAARKRVFRNHRAYHWIDTPTTPTVAIADGAELE